VKKDNKYRYKDLVQKEIDDGSDITSKAVSDIRVPSDKQISIRKLRRNTNQGNCLMSFCRFLGSCFDCFRSQDQITRYSSQNNKTNKVKKKARNGNAAVLAVSTEERVDLEAGQPNS
jgi:hypothetical protein